MKSAPLATALCLLSIASAFAGCVTDEPLPAYVGVSYQLRCQGECTSSQDSPVRTIAHVNGEDDMDVRCRTRGSGDSRTVDVSAKCPAGGPGCGTNGFSFAIDYLAVGRKGNDPGDNCTVTIREGNNRYQSACTGGEVGEEVRCVIDAELDEKDNGLSEITGTLRCRDIPNEASPDITRYLVAPGTSDPASFLIQGCEGL